MKITLKEKRFPSATGNCQCRYRMWIPDEVRAAVQLTHGMAEHIDRYDEFARYLAENGVLVYGQDHAGHGKSVGEGMPKGFFAEQNGKEMSEWQQQVIDRICRRMEDADEAN